MQHDALQGLVCILAVRFIYLRLIRRDEECNTVVKYRNLYVACALKEQC